MKIYTIIGGVNGSGKSSLTGALKAERTDLGQIIDVDKITAENGGDALAGGREAVTRINNCLERGISFTQETTLSGYKTEHTASKAKEQGYHVRLYYVGVNTVDECLKRIENRVSKGGHNIPAETVQKRFSRRFEALLKVLPYCDEAVFFDNENGFTEVAEYANGEIIPKGNYRPEWLAELIKITK